MNKLHVIAKVAFGMLGIYLIISVINSVLSFAIMAAQSFQTYHGWALIGLVTYGAVLFGYIWLVYYLLFRRADIFAQKIVGPEESPAPANPFAWYPFALRLAVMAAGFLFLQSSIWALQQVVHSVRFNFKTGYSGGSEYLYRQVVFFLIYLAISIYLLCGAPQFVCWHVKKTEQLYRRV
jgi:hypothetical protein